MAHSNKSLILVTFKVEQSYFSGVVDKRSYTYRKISFDSLVVKAYQTMDLPYSFLDNLEEDYRDFSEEDHNRPISIYSRRVKSTYQVFRVGNGEVVQFNLDGVRKLAIQKWLEINSRQPRKREYYTRYPNPYRRGPVAHTHKYRSKYRSYMRHPSMRNAVIQNTDAEYKEFRNPDYRMIQDGWYHEGKYERRGSKSWKKNTKCRKQYEKHLK